MIRVGACMSQATAAAAAAAYMTMTKAIKITSERMYVCVVVVSRSSFTASSGGTDDGYNGIFARPAS